ncbi:hypothetical protein BDY21DRAFT_288364 [Lineolata rhizophorae]|uniref:Pentatricopeptide repeat-containing protein-mitochondrial domain-containing protein n=1 Tax=Lineolata rhizophorae TaxID=578093 RepID=A0A6A6NWJ3_9PEZI|nr:hypothetical protein BDY21DRAFT_288364 [Lineolata rhizophorae]
MVNYEELPTHILYEKLRAYALGLKKSPTKAIIQYLIQNRGEGPNPQLYSALILYNTSAEDGSAPMTRALWDEMRAARIEPTSSNCEDVLKVLSVHPDYLFRHEVLDYMNERWFKLSVDALHDVVAGTLRERQLEFALDKLEELIEQRDAKPWIYDMAVYVLVEAGELNEALRILKLRVANCLNGPSSSLWHHFLDQASSLYNHEATEYVWKSQVESGYLIPPSGICENVMATAARHGDVQLATDVFRFLGDRKTVFNHSHYEMLIDAYVATGDIKTALHILCVMNDAGVVPSLPSTRSLTYYMSEEQRRSRWGFKVLYQLAQQKDKKIPRAGINAVIEASVRGAHFEDALEQYKALHAVCKFGPDRHTFNALLKGAVANDRKDIAMFLAAEMGALKVKPDSLTYDRLLLICIADKDCDGAMGYYGDMRARGWLPRRGTLNALVKTFALRKDLRAFKVLQDMVDAGHEVWKLKGWLRDHWEGPQYELDALFGSVDFEKDFDEDATRPMSIKAMSG